MNQEVKMKPSYLKIAFLDRDGTIIKDYPDEKWREIKEPEFLEGSIEGLKRLKEMGYDFIIITNQYLSKKIKRRKYRYSKNLLLST